MELDELKSAWQILDHRLERQSALSLHLFRQDKLDRMRSSLRPLFIGQLLQIAFGVCFVVLAGLLWASAAAKGIALIAAGVTVHAYGVACIVLAGATLARIRHIDYAAPVVEIQKSLARLRRAYIVNGMIAGMAWWFLWIPLLMVLAGIAGVDLGARAPEVIGYGVGIGVAGLAVTYAFHRWSQQPGRERVARAVDDSITGSSLRNARRVLEEIEHFAHD